MTKKEFLKFVDMAASPYITIVKPRNGAVTGHIYLTSLDANLYGEYSVLLQSVRRTVDDGDGWSNLYKACNKYDRWLEIWQMERDW